MKKCYHKNTDGTSGIARGIHNSTYSGGGGGGTSTNRSVSGFYSDQPLNIFLCRLLTKNAASVAPTLGNTSHFKRYIKLQ